jgi:hypothetical protein
MSAVYIQPGSDAGSLLFTTVLIQVKTGNQIGTGTGFIFNHIDKNEKVKDRGLPFLVTNRHVVEEANAGQLVFLKAADKQLSRAVAGQTFSITIIDFANAWFYHPDPSIDLCIMQLSTYLNMALRSHGVRLFMRSVNYSNIPTEENISQMDVIEDIIMVGYPNSLMDEINHLPIVRRGITATPYQADYNSRSEFIIDASVFPGSSGSPVFLVDRYKESSDPSKRLFLMGILSSGFVRVRNQQTTRIHIPITESAINTVAEMLDLGIVIKSQRLVELVELWLDAFPSATPQEQKQNEEEAVKVNDKDVNRLIYRLQQAFSIQTWRGLKDHLTSLTWSLLIEFKGVGLVPLERLLLKRLLEDALNEVMSKTDAD